MRLWITVLASAVLGGGWTWAASLKVRTVEMEWDVRVPGTGGGTVRLWIPAPWDDLDQTVRNLRITSPGKYQIGAGAHGNQSVYTEVRRGDTVKMRFEVTRRERVRRLVASQEAGDDPGPGCCTTAEKLVPLDARVRAWALEVVGNARTDLAKARAIYDHVVATVRYDKSGEGWGRGDIFYACDRRRGNCTDFHAIVIGYARAVGLPARFHIGAPLPAERGSGGVDGYHCWAEIYARGVGWVPVDASEAWKNPARRDYYFGSVDENRVEFTRGRDIVLAPGQNGEPLNYYFYPHAEEGGRGVGKVDLSVRYWDRR